MINFAGHRNNSHFVYKGDPVLGDYFSADVVWDVRIFNNMTDFQQMVTDLRAEQTGDNIIGGYHSALYALDQSLDSLPPAKIPLEIALDPTLWTPSVSNPSAEEWILRDEDGHYLLYSNPEGTSPGRHLLNITVPEVRDAIIYYATTRAKANGLDAVCYDNCSWGLTATSAYPPISVAEWTEGYMKFFEIAGQTANDEGLLCFVNVSTYAAQIPNAFAAISPYVDGIMSEMAFHPNVRDNLQDELDAYEAVLQQGKYVLVVPRYSADEDFALQQIAPLARTYRKIYLSTAGAIHHNPLYTICV